VTGRRGAALLFAAFLLGIAVFYGFTLRPGHDWGDDFAMYVHHAKNIAQGLPYGQTGYIWNPRFPMMGPPTYPPVFPLMLAPVYAVFGLDLMPMKWVGIASFLGALLLTALLFRRFLSPLYLAVLLALLGLNPYFWRLKDAVLSDLPFFFFTYLALYLLQRQPGPDRPRGRVALHAVAFGIACYLAYGTRSLGVVLIPCAILTELSWRRRISWWNAVAALVFVLLAALQAAVSHRDSGYAAILSLDPHRIALNVVEYARYLSGLWDNAWVKTADTWLLALFGLLAAMGLLARLRAKPGPLEIFAVLYGLAILPWIATQGRYLIPLMPIYVGFALWAVQVMGKRSPNRARLILAGLTVLAGLGFASIYTTTPMRGGPEGVGTPDAVGLWQAVERITSSEDVILFQKPRALALFTGRRSTAIHDAGSDQEVLDYVRGVDARYAIVGPDDPAFLYQERIRHAIEADPGTFSLVYRNPEFAMYRIRLPEPR